MDGFLCIDKPQDVTSRRVVNRIQPFVRPAKIGHAGTLDPLATGVLILAVGKATRLVPYVQRMPKTYRASFRLGTTSDTEDITGDLISHEVPCLPTHDDVLQVCQRFVGQVSQRPPSFSALKVGGRRSYELARAGQAVQLKERPVSIFCIEITAYAFPQLEVRVECGSGTYIRSLGRDIGAALGCGAVMTDLRRTAIGDFKLKDAHSPAELNGRAAVQAQLRPPRDGVQYLPFTQLSEDELTALSYGRKIQPRNAAAPEMAAMAGQASLAAVLARTAQGDYRATVNLVAK